MKIKTGDKVIVISGRYKGSVGEVKAVSPKTNRVIVEGVNLAKKTLKPTQENPEGGVLEMETPINASNVQLYDDKAKKGIKVGYQVNGKGSKVRINKATGKEVKGGSK